VPVPGGAGLLANKWSALAVGALEEGPQRFGVLQRRLEGVGPRF
jgi:DNA-binding HxlR family transcriptional regulator